MIIQFKITHRGRIRRNKNNTSMLTACLLILACIFFIILTASNLYAARDEVIRHALDEWELKYAKQKEKIVEKDTEFRSWVDVKGYNKIILGASKDYSGDENYYSLLNRLRLNWDFGLTENLSAKVTYDNEFTLGNILRTEDLFYIQLMKKKKNNRELFRCSET